VPVATVGGVGVTAGPGHHMGHARADLLVAAGAPVHPARVRAGQ
jgi:hypothetical protein